MPKDMLINVSEGEECRIAILDDGRLEELYMERTSATSHVGNIYKGRVTNVEASIQAAFIDFGLGRNGFLHISDLMPEYFGEHGDDLHESVGHKISRRDRPPIQRCLRRGDEIIVQIIKEGIGTKGPTLTTYLSIPGRILVMMPGMGKMGVSKKIEDDTERRRLRQILDSLEPPRDVGFIIRTAGIGKSKADIERDFKYLMRLHENIEQKRTSGVSPIELYTEGDLITRTVRDLFTSDIERIVVDNAEVADQLRDFIKIAMPRTKNRVELYDRPVPLFHEFNIEHEIEMMHSRHVPLPSGGSLVIDSTEAVVAIDVNSGKSREHADAEMMAFNTDMEAADEIPRQLKLRDLGGVIICDFIDLRFERHRRELEQRLEDNLNRDRAKTKVLRMSQFGIIELTRQRMRPSLKRSIYFDCPHCRGSGLVKTSESMTLDVMRRLALAIHDDRVRAVELSVCADVSNYLQNRKRAALSKLEAETGKRITIRVNPALALDEAKFDCFDEREGLVVIDALNTGGAPKEAERGGRRSRRGGRNRTGRPLPASRTPSEAAPSGEDLFDDAPEPHHPLPDDSEPVESSYDDDADPEQRDDQREERRDDGRRNRDGRDRNRQDGRRDDGRSRDNRNRDDNRNRQDDRRGGDRQRDGRNDRGERAERDNRGERTDRDNRGERTDRDNRGERSERDNRGERSERDNRDNRGDRNQHGRHDQPARGDDRGGQRQGGDRQQGGRNQQQRNDGRQRNGNDRRPDGRDGQRGDQRPRQDHRQPPAVPNEYPADDAFAHEPDLHDETPAPGNERLPDDGNGQPANEQQQDGGPRRRRRRRGGRGRRGRGNGNGNGGNRNENGSPADPIYGPSYQYEENRGDFYSQPPVGRSDDEGDESFNRDDAAYSYDDAESSVEDRYDARDDSVEPSRYEPEAIESDPEPIVEETTIASVEVEAVSAEPVAEVETPVEPEAPAPKKRSTRARSTTAKAKAAPADKPAKPRATRSRKKAATTEETPAADASAGEASGVQAEPEAAPAKPRATRSRRKPAAVEPDEPATLTKDEIDAVDPIDVPRRPRSYRDLDSIPDEEF